MIRAILIDDEQIALDVLEILIRKNGSYEIVGRFTMPEKALNQLKILKPDVVFLDMEMGAIDGLEAAELILKCQPSVEIVFVTAYSKYAVEAFEINAMDYLLKPIRADRLAQTTDRLKRHFETRTSPSKEGIIQVFSSVQVLDSDGNYIKWRTKKVKELFAYLWHFKGRLIPKDVLVEALWPETPPEKSMPLLHTTVYQLRKALPFSEAVAHIDEGYVLNVTAPSDCGQIESIMEMSHPDAVQIQLLIDAYKDGYMAHEGYPWSNVTRSRMERQVIEILESYVEETNLAALRLPILDKLLEFNPYSERYAAWMMAYLDLTANKGQITDFYNHFSKRLKEDLNIEPSMDLSHKCNSYIRYIP